MSSSIHAQIEEKRRDLDELRKVQRFISVLVEQLSEIEGKLDVMCEGAESVALVLSYWKDVMASVSLASMGLANHATKYNSENEELPEKLVRIPWQAQSGSGSGSESE